MSANAAADEHQELITRLEAIKTQLDRIEQRQIQVKGEIETSQPVGGFGSGMTADEQRQGQT